MAKKLLTQIKLQIVGGAANPAVLDHDDARLASLAHTTLARLLAIHHEPVLSRLYRFPASMPQYRPGQAAWIADIRARVARYPGLLLAGSTVGSIGFGDCAQSGEDAARAAFDFLAGRPTRPAPSTRPALVL